MTRVDPVYRPTNRTGRAPLGELAFTVADCDWYVDDIDSNNRPIAYGSPWSTWRIMPDRGGKFILCGERGMFLTHPKRRGESKGRTRYFSSLAHAARLAMEINQ